MPTTTRRRAAEAVRMEGLRPRPGTQSQGPQPAIDPTDPEIMETAALSDQRDAIVAIIARWGYDRRAKPFQLSSAGWSRDYIDGKKAVAHGSRLTLVGKAIAEVAAEAGVKFEAVGGMTMGADPIAVAVAIACDVGWFFVRKEPKLYGKQKLIEGAELKPGTRVLLVDDVATTGRSMLDALDPLQELGVEVVMAIPLIDRGDLARARVEERGIRYEPVITYRDMGIEPTHRGRDGN